MFTTLILAVAFTGQQANGTFNPRAAVGMGATQPVTPYDVWLDQWHASVRQSLSEAAMRAEYERYRAEQERYRAQQQRLKARKDRLRARTAKPPAAPATDKTDHAKNARRELTKNREDTQREQK